MFMLAFDGVLLVVLGCISYVRSRPERASSARPCHSKRTGEIGGPTAIACPSPGPFKHNGWNRAKNLRRRCFLLHFQWPGVKLAIPWAVGNQAIPARIRMPVQLPVSILGRHKWPEGFGVLFPVPGVFGGIGALQDAVPLAGIDLDNPAFALAAHDFLRAGGFTTQALLVLWVVTFQPSARNRRINSPCSRAATSQRSPEMTEGVRSSSTLISVASFVDTACGVDRSAVSIGAQNPRRPDLSVSRT